MKTKTKNNFYILEIQEGQSRHKLKMETLQQENMTGITLDIPIFQGEGSKDTIGVANFLNQFEEAAESAGLTTDNQKAKHFGNYLFGVPYCLYQNLELADVDQNNWKEVRNYFLEKFQWSEEAMKTRYLPNPPENSMKDLPESKSEFKEGKYDLPKQSWNRRKGKRKSLPTKEGDQMEVVRNEASHEKSKKTKCKMDTDARTEAQLLEDWQEWLQLYNSHRNEWAENNWPVLSGKPIIDFERYKVEAKRIEEWLIELDCMKEPIDFDTFKAKIEEEERVLRKKSEAETHSKKTITSFNEEEEKDVRLSGLAETFETEADSLRTTFTINHIDSFDSEKFGTDFEEWGTETDAWEIFSGYLPNFAEEEDEDSKPSETETDDEKESETDDEEEIETEDEEENFTNENAEECDLPIWNDPEIPYFSGLEKEGSITFDEFIRIFERETDMIGLKAPEQKAEFVEAYLTGAAYRFYTSLALLGVDAKDWEAVKICFLSKFLRRSSTQSIILVDNQSRQENGKEKLQKSKISESTETMIVADKPRQVEVNEEPQSRISQSEKVSDERLTKKNLKKISESTETMIVAGRLRQVEVHEEPQSRISKSEKISDERLTKENLKKISESTETMIVADKPRQVEVNEEPQSTISKSETINYERLAKENLKEKEISQNNASICNIRNPKRIAETMIVTDKPRQMKVNEEPQFKFSKSEIACNQVKVKERPKDNLEEEIDNYNLKEMKIESNQTIMLDYKLLRKMKIWNNRTSINKAITLSNRFSLLAEEEDEEFTEKTVQPILNNKGKQAKMKKNCENTRLHKSAKTKEHKVKTENLKEKEIAQTSQIQTARGHQLFYRNSRKAREEESPYSVKNKDIECGYCKELGHKYKECQKRNLDPALPPTPPEKVCRKGKIKEDEFKEAGNKLLIPEFDTKCVKRIKSPNGKQKGTPETQNRNKEERQMESPDSAINVDIFEMRNQSDKKKNFILCVTDKNTKYAELIAIKDKEVHTIDETVFISWIRRCEIPSKFSEDSEFCKLLLEKFSTLLDASATCKLLCLSRDEMANTQIQIYLQQFVESKTLDWKNDISSLMLCYHTSFHRTIQTSPYFLTFGTLARQPNFAPADLTGRYLEPQSPEIRQKMVQEAREVAWKNSVHQHENYQAQYDQKASPHNFQVNQWVLLQQNYFLNKNAKLAEQYEGPFKILQLKGTNNAIIQVRRRKICVNTNCLKPYHGSSSFETFPKSFQKQGGELEIDSEKHSLEDQNEPETKESPENKENDNQGWEQPKKRKRGRPRKVPMEQQRKKEEEEERRIREQFVKMREQLQAHQVQPQPQPQPPLQLPKPTMPHADPVPVTRRPTVQTESETESENEEETDEEDNANEEPKPHIFVPQIFKQNQVKSLEENVEQEIKALVEKKRQAFFQKIAAAKAKEGIQPELTRKVSAVWQRENPIRTHYQNLIKNATPISRIGLIKRRFPEWTEAQLINFLYSQGGGSIPSAFYDQFNLLRIPPAAPATVPAPPVINWEDEAEDLDIDLPAAVLPAVPHLIRPTINLDDVRPEVQFGNFTAASAAQNLNQDEAALFQKQILWLVYSTKQGISSRTRTSNSSQ